MPNNKVVLWNQWKQIVLVDQRNIFHPLRKDIVNLSYQKSSSADIFAEINRLRAIANAKIQEEKEMKEQLDRNIERGKAIIKRNREIYRKKMEEENQLRENEKKSQVKTIDEIIHFLNNPVAKKFIFIGFNSLNFLLNQNVLKFYDYFDLVLTIDGYDFWTLRKTNIENLQQAIFDEHYIVMNKGFGSDSIIKILVKNPDSIIRLVWKPTSNKQPIGGYFEYYHNLLKIDLSRYGVYRNYKETNAYELNCLEIALLNGGISKQNFNRLKNLIKTRFIPQKDLKIIAQELDINIILTKIYKINRSLKENNEAKEKRNFKYGSEGKQKFNIALYEQHYFLIEPTIYTSYSIKNYFKINGMRDFNKIYNKNNKRCDDRKIDSLDLIKILIESISRGDQNESHLTKIDMTNCGLFSQYSNRMIDYKDLPNIKKSEFKSCDFDSPRSRMRTMEKKCECPDGGECECQRNMKIKKEYKINTPKILRGKTYGVLYFDTETTTNEEIHKSYMICSIDRENKKANGMMRNRSPLENNWTSEGENLKCFIGEYCILNWLKSLRQNYICIAHNLRYDFQFIVKYLNNVRSMIKTGNKIKSISGEFYNRDTETTIHLNFKDSYSFLSMPLRKFSECFNLRIKKQILPYEIYRNDTVNLPHIKLIDALTHVKDEERREFLQNIIEWKCLLPSINYLKIYLTILDGDLTRLEFLDFDHIKYSKKYCEMDVKVLRDGYEIFRKDMHIVSSFDIDNACSIPQIATNYGGKFGVFEGCYLFAGVPRDFIQKDVVGGQCMTAENKKFEIKHNVDDFDGVALYPSAMERIPGFLKGKPKVWNKSIDINQVDGYFLEIEVLEVPSHRKFPLLSRITENGVREFDNKIKGDKIWVNKFSLEDLVEFQQVKYKILRGYYFNEGRNNKINEFIRMLFNERLKVKKNPIQLVYKLLMNSFYGRLIMNPIETKYKFVYGKEKCDKYLSYHFNNIINYSVISDGMIMFKEQKSIMSHFSMPHCGSEILSMSKRIMHEVMCLAEDIGVEIYYQDTDSMHIDARKNSDGKTGIQQLAEAFRIKYGREIVGKQMGQFHSDFDYKSETPPISVNSIYLGKKAYCDKVEITIDKKIEYVDHCRMKGIPESVLKNEIKNGFKGDALSMYRYLLNEKNYIKFDLLEACKFKFNNNFTTINNEKFIRKVRFVRLITT